MKKYKILRCILFLVVLVLIIGVISDVAIPETMIKRQIALYEEQPTDSIDIAFIGNSSTRAYYDVMTIWDTYGITSMSYAISGMPYDLTIPMIEYVLEDQSPELFVIELRKVLQEDSTIKYFGMYETESKEEAYISALNLFPESIYRLDEVWSSNFLEGERYMFFSDILYNHESAFDYIYEWAVGGFSVEALEYKQNERLSFAVTDMTDSYVVFDETEFNEDYTLADETVERIVELLEYCEEKELNVYFTFSPYVDSKHVYDAEARSEIVELVESYGYPITDYRSEFEEIGLDVTTDFQDASHVNILGANKYTLYAMEDFLEVYDISSDYDQEVVDSWDETYALWESYYDRKMENLISGDVEEELSETTD